MSLEEYRAIRERAGVRERYEAGRIALAGADRLTYLHAMLTNDITALKPGSGCYSAYLTPQGRMIADMRVLELGGLTLLDLPRSASEEVRSKLEQFIFSEDVQVSDLTDQLADVLVIGPDGARVVASVFPDDRDNIADALTSLADCASIRAALAGSQVVVTANRTLGVPAFDIFIDRDKLALVMTACSHAGAATLDEATVEVVRIEAGTPRFGIDMNETTIPLEAGIEGRAISFTKGCYPGQEVIVRVVQRGHGRVARRLAGVVLEGDAIPEAGDPFKNGDSEIGRVTSAAMSPALGVPIVLGYLHRDFVAPGMSVSVEHAGARLNGRVVELPFVK